MTPFPKTEHNACNRRRRLHFAEEDYSTSYVLLATNDNAWTFAGDDALTMTGIAGDAIEYLPDGAAYISLSQFYGNAVNQFLAAAEKINELGCTSLILDLRNDGGGLVSAMQGISGCFEGPAGEVVMTARYKDGSSESYAAASYSAEQTIGSDVDVYVLANSNTASASEALIGALVSYEVLDYNNIYISQYSQEYLDSMNVIAEQVKSGKTYGKGIMQTTFRNFATGEALKLTTAQIYWDNGKTIHGRRPDCGGRLQYGGSARAVQRRRRRASRGRRYDLRLVNYIRNKRKKLYFFRVIKLQLFYNFSA